MTSEVKRLLDAVPWDKMIVQGGYIRTKEGCCPIAAFLGGNNMNAAGSAVAAGFSRAAAIAVMDAADDVETNDPTGEIRAEMLRRIEAAKNTNPNNQNGAKS